MAFSRGKAGTSTRPVWRLKSYSEYMAEAYEEYDRREREHMGIYSGTPMYQRVDCPPGYRYHSSYGKHGGTEIRWDPMLPTEPHDSLNPGDWIKAKVKSEVAKQIDSRFYSLIRPGIEKIVQEKVDERISKLKLIDLR